MLTHKDLLKDFSINLGIPKFAARQALEEFALIIARNLNFGDQIEINSLGFFAYKKIKTPGEDKYNFHQLLIYSKEKISSLNKNIIFFFLPSNSRSLSGNLDSYLNLSFDKPLITSIKDAGSKVIDAVAENELLGLIQTKTEKLFSEGIIHKSFDESEQEFFLPQQHEEIVFNTSTIEADDFPSEKFEPLKIFDDFAYAEGATEPTQSTQHLNHETGDENFSEANSKTAEDKIKLGRSEKKSRKRFLLFTAAALILIIASGIYFNYDKISALLFDIPELEHVKSEDKTKPVSEENTAETSTLLTSENNIQTIDSLYVSSEESNTKPNNNEVSLSDELSSTTANEEIREKFVRVQGYVFKKKEQFYVQLSSWKAKSKAEKEVNKYKELGYSAELTTYNSSELGRFYKVMIGAFNSIEDAKNFLKQNQ